MSACEQCGGPKLDWQRFCGAACCAMHEMGAPKTKPTNWLYVRRMFATALAVLGAFFLGEHIYSFGFEYWDFIGHEYLGLGCIVGAVLLGMRWQRNEPENDYPHYGDHQ